MPTTTTSNATPSSDDAPTPAAGCPVDHAALAAAPTPTPEASATTDAAPAADCPVDHHGSTLAATPEPAAASAPAAAAATPDAAKSTPEPAAASTPAAATPAAAAKPAPSTPPQATPQTKSGRTPHGISSPLALARQLRSIRANPLAALDRSTQRFGHAFRLSAPGTADNLFFNDPDLAKAVLLTNQDDYEKSSQYEILQRVLGMGLVTSEGELWREHRTIVQPMFAKRALGDFAEHMAAASQDALDRWERTWQPGETVDLSEEMSSLTLDIVGRALVGTDFSARSSEFGEALTDMLIAAGQVGRSPISMIAGGIKSIGVSKGMRAQPLRVRRMNTAIDTLDDVVLEVIANRRRSEAEHHDLLSVLMSYRHPETGAALTETHLRDELMTFVTAGHETTANGLAWMWSLLSQHPEARERLLAEVDEVLEGRTPTAADLDRLPWTTACFQEAMRLYPPVWMVQRRAKRDTRAGDYEIKAGTIIAISPWVIHRDPRFWPNPSGFDPRRFLDDAPKQRPREAYIPFAAGRRMCIGQGFAMMEATLMTAMLSQRYTFDLVPGANLEPEPTVTLRPKHGVPVVAHRRDA